ncbi:MAG: 3'-5' exonuclease [Chloroflexota bacterium]
MDHAQSRHEAIEKAQAFLAQKPVFLDTETTGTHNRAEIIEICIVGSGGQVLVDSLVQPVNKIPKDATKIHGISNEMVKDALTWTALWPEVEAALSSQHIGIYNADFDLRLIKQTHKKRKLEWEPIGAKGFCIMKLYAQFYGEWDETKGDFKWQSLTKAGDQCAINIPNSHRAKSDTLLARAVLHHIANSSQ